MINQHDRQIRNAASMIKLNWPSILVICLLKINLSWAEQSTINNLEFSTLAGNQVQIQLDISGPIAEPKIFQTDNPSRIALDFNGVSSNLAKKSFPVNQGAASTVYVVEASGRTRVIVNLNQKVPYETKVDGNKFTLMLKPAGFLPVLEKPVTPPPSSAQALPSFSKGMPLSSFLPQQSIKSLDFKRGPNGEGRILLEFSNPNTLVDAKQVAGKVVLSFLKTTLPENLHKSLDVSDFATPVQKIESTTKGDGVVINVVPNSPNFEYSSFQTDNLLTVEFRPLTAAEKEAKLKEKQPYVGSKLSLNFQEIDVKSVLMILSDHIKTQEGKEVNIVTTDSVSGTVALHVNDVPWDQVLDVVMKLRGLSKRENGNVILVGPTEEIKTIEEKELEARRVYELLEPLKTENIQINYARAIDLCNILIGKGNFNQGDVSLGGTGGSSSGGGGGSGCGTSSGGGGQSGGSQDIASFDRSNDLRLLSARGAVIVDARTNTLIVKDTPKQIEEIRKMVAKLDIPVRQVMIESRIVIASKDFVQDLGVKFGAAKFNFNGGTQSVIGASGQCYPEAVGDGQPSGSHQSICDTGDYMVDLGAKAINAYPPAALGMTLMRIADYVLNLEISALQQNGLGEIVSNPRVMTSDRVKATIVQGTEIPYQSSSGNLGTNIQFKNAYLELSVTPQITPNGAVIMQLLVSKDNPAADGTGSIEKREIKTLVKVNDGETVVLGGVYENNSGSDSYEIPYLSEIPGIGFMFKNKRETERQRELLIFITPKIIKDGLVSK